MSDQIDFEKINRTTEPGTREESIAALEAQLQQSQDKLKEGKFFCGLVGLILFDCIVFRDMASASGPISILILELVALLIFAKKLGIEELVEIVDKIIHSVAGKNKP